MIRALSASPVYTVRRPVAAGGPVVADAPTSGAGGTPSPQAPQASGTVTGLSFLGNLFSGTIGWLGNIFKSLFSWIGGLFGGNHVTSAGTP